MCCTGNGAAGCLCYFSQPSSRAAFILAWSQSTGMSRQGKQLLPEREDGRALEGRGLTPDITGRGLEWTSQFVDSSCTVLCLKGPSCVRWKDPEIEGKPKK